MNITRHTIGGALFKDGRARLAVAVFSFAAVGAIVLVVGRAAIPTVSIEPEGGTTYNGATRLIDTTASGGEAIKFAASTPQACAGYLPHQPGGQDGMGGCWPGAHNTGYPKGLAGDTRAPVTLTQYTGSMVISTCGVVIDSKIVNGDIEVRTGNGTKNPDTPCVTIKNSLVNGSIYTDSPDYGPVVIKDTEVHVQWASWWPNIGMYNYYAWRVDSHGGEGVLKCQSYCKVYDSYVHGMYLSGSYHYNAFGNNGIENADGFFVIEHNYASCGDFEGKDTNVTGDAGCSAVIGFYGDFAPVRNITINKNFLASGKVTAQYDSGTQPGYCYNPGYYEGKPYPTPSNITFTNNIFARGETSKCGIYGASNTWYVSGSNVWANNKYDDGTLINAP